MNPFDNPPPIRHAEAKGLAMLLLAGLLLLGFLMYVLVARGFFEDSQHLVLTAENSEGVSVGMDMTFSGFPIGRVVRIELGDDGRAHLHINVPTRDARWLRTSSIFTLERGVVGGTRLRAFTGILEDPPLPDGSRREVLIGDAAAGVPQLVNSIQQLILNLETLTNNQSALNAVLANLQTLTAGMTGRYGALTTILGSEAHARQAIESLARTNELIAKADERLFRQGGLMDEAQTSASEVSRLLVDARASLAKADAALEDVRKIAGNARVATEDLDALRNEIEANLRKLSGMLDEVNRKWPFAREREVQLP
jgi:phospholipid/cholesterol/gamma-HCH transport system substrate-binding protein